MDKVFIVFTALCVLLILYKICSWLFGFPDAFDDFSLLGAMLNSGRGIVIWIAAIGFILYGIVISFQYSPLIPIIVLIAIIAWKFLF